MQPVKRVKFYRQNTPMPTLASLSIPPFGVPPSHPLALPLGIPLVILFCHHPLGNLWKIPLGISSHGALPLPTLAFP